MESIMVYIYSESEEFEESQESSRLRVSRRLLRSKSSPLDLPSTEFIKLFRLSKEAFVFILQEISEEFKDQNSNGIPSILKLAATMRFLAEGSYQKGVGQDVLLGMAQPTVSNVLSETLKILERKLCPKMINFKMNEQEKLEAKTAFYENSGFPGVIMCVDGTHVSIIRPTTNEHHFYNRKGYHSLNVMVIKYTKVDYNSGKGSKIAAFLPERQLWGWLGQTYRKAVFKGRARKHFYKSISRGEETITVGECAVFLSTGRPDRPYIGRIEAFWETTSSNKIVRVRWFYHPEETIGCPSLKYPGALFDSPHEDENDVQTISHRCEVIEFSMYIAKFGSDPTNYQSIYDNNDIYYLSGYYNPRLRVLTMQPQIPTLDDGSL